MASVQAVGIAVDPDTILGFKHLGPMLCPENQRTLNHVSQLQPGGRWRVEGTPFDTGQKVRDTRNDIAIRNQYAHALREQERTLSMIG